MSRWYRRAWLWDLVHKRWLLIWDAPIDSRFPPGVNAGNEPQPFVYEQWWERAPSGEWVYDVAVLNYPPYVV